MTTFVNLTPHSITLHGGGVPARVVYPSGTVARVLMTERSLGTRAHVRVVSNTPTGLVGLLPPKEDTIYIVSAMVISYLKSREAVGATRRAGVDVFAPDTGSDAIRGPDGQVIGVCGLVC